MGSRLGQSRGGGEVGAGLRGLGTCRTGGGVTDMMRRQKNWDKVWGGCNKVRGEAEIG